MKYTHYETLLAFCEAMRWASDPEEVFHRFVDVSTEYFECAAAHLHLLDLTGKSFDHLASHEERVAPDFYRRSLNTQIGRMGWMVENRELIIMEDYEHPHAQDEIPLEAVQAGYRSAVSIPLSSSSGVLGLLSIVYKCPLPWETEEDLAFLRQVGNVLGTFIQRVQMEKKELDLHVLQERKQLSSEIHDSISQMASALALHADTAQVCFEDGDMPSLNKELKVLSDQLRQMSAVLRDEMLSLRTPLTDSGTIEEVLEDVLDRFRNLWDIDAHLHVGAEAPQPLSGHARLQLARIVNESVLNVMRHSRAQSVDIYLSRRNGCAIIAIVDDGMGFDPGNVAPERLGIRIMRERAESVGGSLEVASGSEGTTVRLEIPVMRA